MKKTYFELAKGLMMGLLIIGGAATASGEIRVLYSDGGIYTGPGQDGSQPSDVLCWQDGGACPTIDGSYDRDPDAPEGQEVFSARTTRPWAGWGIFNTTDFVSKVVAERDWTQFQNGGLQFWLKSENNLALEVEYGDGIGQLSARYNLPSTNGEWVPYSIPFSQFNMPITFSRLRAAFKITIAEGNGVRQWFVDNVRINSELPGPIATFQISPTAIRIPPGEIRIFTAEGYDAQGRPVDVLPTWSTFGGNIGQILDPASGSAIRFEATSLAENDPAVTGGIRAQFNGFTANANVTVENQIVTQAFPIYNDTGLGDSVVIGVAEGPDGSGSFLTLEEITTDGTNTPEGIKYMQADYRLDDGDTPDSAYAVWFATTTYPEGRYMRPFSNGTLRFNVRTNHDLLISMSSRNIPEGDSKAKVFLSQLNVPLDDQWHEVSIPLGDFRLLESRLDFDQITNFFTIGGDSAVLPTGNFKFDVDNVEWLTADAAFPNADKVYVGLVEKQQPSGLVQSFGDNRAVTYDQALAAMAFTYNGDYLKTRAIFDAYKSMSLGRFGYYDEYHTQTLGVLDGDRMVGPNAWLLMSIVHFKYATGSTDYDVMMNNLARWIAGYQDTDGGIKMGIPQNGVGVNTKPTEFALDVVAAFSAYAPFSADAGNEFSQRAQDAQNWLQTQAWIPNQERFAVGIEDSGINRDKALDIYSWAPLVLGESYARVLPLAARDFLNRQLSVVTRSQTEGFDFGGTYNQAIDKDAVWLEGTAQMAVAYDFVGDNDNYIRFINEIEKNIFDISATGQGIPYATNPGTMYPSGTMNATDPSASSMAWYLFAKEKFNPFLPFSTMNVDIRNISDNQPVNEINWTVNVPNDSWVLANQYVQMSVRSASKSPWGVQIYTDNTRDGIVPKFIDPSPGDPNNFDSSPAGLLLNLPGQPQTAVKLPLAWSIKDTTSDAPQASDPNTGPEEDPGNRYQWLFMKDRATPDTDLDGNGEVGDPGDGTAFQDGELFITVKNKDGIHFGQGPDDIGPAPSPDFIYFQADFTTAAAEVNYSTEIILEFYYE